uniref:Uncharacterized protein n=1 Tax=Caenorhabditis japonica TaxID=281687 RepID=A0A8R1DTK3_CAEJA
MLSELVIIFSIFIVFVVGCAKKKNEACKLRPRDLDAKGGAVATGPGKPEKSKSEQKGDGQVPKMSAREADDNETINDAKSDWGVLK